MNRGKSYTMKEAIRAVMKRGGLRDKYQESRVITAWEQVMGKVINRNTRHLRMRNGCLTVQLNSAPLKQELSYNTGKIKEVLNKEVGEEVVRKVVIR